MDERQRHQVAMGVGVALALASFFPNYLGVILPSWAAWTGMVFAGFFFLWGLWPLVFNMFNKPAPPLAPQNGTVISGSNNVVSNNQSGGVTAHTFINQAVMPVFKILGQTEKSQPDGSIAVTFTAEVEAQVTPAALHLTVEAAGLINVRIVMPTVNGVSMTRLNNKQTGPGYFSASIPEPNGQFQIVAQTAHPAQIKIQGRF